GGCGVKFPNSSPPLSINPLPFRSRTSQASSEPANVQEYFSLKPSALRSKNTPSAKLVNAKSLPSTSITTGEKQRRPSRLAKFVGSQGSLSSGRIGVGVG